MNRTRQPEACRAASANFDRIVPLAAVVSIGVVAIVLLAPTSVLADDCLRDPFNAEDCLRTSGWAPVLAGGIASLVSIFISLGEIPGTLHASAAAASGASVPNWRTIWDRIGRTHETPEQTEDRRQREQATADKIRKAEPVWRVIIAGGVGVLTWAGVAVAAAIAGVTVGWWAAAIAGAAALWSYFTPDVFGPIIQWFTGPPEKD